MHDLLNLDRYPFHEPRAAATRALVRDCRRALAEQGMFNLEGFLRPEARDACLADLRPRFANQAFTHRRDHNIYFDDAVAGLAPDHPALARFETVNHTLCADQVADGPLARVYEWTPFIAFLAAAMGKDDLYPMADPLARINVMAYRQDEALNWHFDRAEFTTTLLLQEPEAGGAFQYRRDLRSATDPNHAGVARLLAGGDPEVRTLTLSPGTLNVFKGRDTAHRVTPVIGGRDRIIAVFSYFERPGVRFTDAERRGFYGRAEPLAPTG